MKLAVLALLLAMVAGDDEPKTFRSEFALAEEALARQDAAAYLAHLDAAMAIDPQRAADAFFRYHRARALALNGRSDQALTALETAWASESEGQIIAFAEFDAAFREVRAHPAYAKVRSLFERMEVTALPAGGSVYEIRGAGCTLAVSVGADGVLLVDSGYPGTSAAVLRALRKVRGDARVRYVVNTHGHYDHVGANHDYAADAVIVAHTAALEEMKNGSDYVKPFGVPPIPERGRADIVTDTSLAIPFNGETVHVIAMPAHSPGDVAVWFEASRVLHLGDDYFGADSAYLDPGRAPTRFFDALRDLLGRIPDEAVVISGHAERVTAAKLKAALAASAALHEIVRDGIASDTPVEAIVDSAVAKGHPRGWASMYVRRLTQN